MRTTATRRESLLPLLVALLLVSACKGRSIDQAAMEKKLVGEWANRSWGTIIFRADHSGAAMQTTFIGEEPRAFVWHLDSSVSPMALDVGGLPSILRFVSESTMQIQFPTVSSGSDAESLRPTSFTDNENRYFHKK